MKHTNTKVIPFWILIATSTVTIASGMHHHEGMMTGGHDEDLDHTHSDHWMAPASEAKRKNPVMADARSIEQGAQLYRQNCASCHGANADGKGMAGMFLSPKPANLRAMAGTHADGDLAYKIKQGRGAMPAWKAILNDEQVWNLVNYIQSLSKTPVARENERPEHKHVDDEGGSGAMNPSMMHNMQAMRQQAMAQGQNGQAPMMGQGMMNPQMMQNMMRMRQQQMAQGQSGGMGGHGMGKGMNPK